MDELDSQYQAVGEVAGIPVDVVHRLKPDEMRVLACIVEHRDRIVAHPELAEYIFGEAGGQECRRIANLLRSVRFALCRYATIAATFTRYRGQLAVGVRWKPKGREESADEV